MPRQLTTYDLLALQEIEKDPNISVRTLWKRVNERIIREDISANYATIRHSKGPMEFCLRRLRSVGLVKPNVTEVDTVLTHQLWQQVGRAWRQWPWYIPIANNNLDFVHMKERYVYA
jgi:hypothetical protein